MIRRVLCVLILLLPIFSFSQCPTIDITLNTQEAIDNFKINYPNCTELQRSITISGDVVNLQGLNEIESINTNLTIRYTRNLENLSGLDALTYVNGNLIISDNTSLISLIGLSNLESTGKNLWIENNSSLSTLVGLESLTIVGLTTYFIQDTSLTLRNNNLLEDLSGLLSLEQINGSLIISNNNISTFLGLNNLLHIKDSFSIGQEKITDFTGLEKLQYIDYSLGIGNCENLINLIGFNSLVKIGNFVNISYNNSLTNLKGLENITQIYREDYPDSGGVYISNNPQLSSLEGLESIVTLANLSFRENISLTDFSGLSSLKTINHDFEASKSNFINFFGLANLEIIQGNFDIVENNGLINFEGLEGLRTINGTVRVVRNSELIDFSGLTKLNSIQGSFNLEYNPKVNSFNGLSSLNSINGLFVIGNQFLSSLNGLESLTSTEGTLRLQNNDVLTDVSSLKNVVNSGTYMFLYISGNPELINLNGVENFNPGGDGILDLINNVKLNDISALTSWNRFTNARIEGNLQLNNCDISPLCELITSTSNNVKISSNGLDCSDRQELAVLCNPEPQCPIGNIVLSTQMDVDNYNNNYPYCTKPEFSIIIEGNDITNLRGLETITDIGGDLVIRNTTNLSNLNDLTSIALVNGSIVIDNNTSLGEIRGIRNIDGYQIESITITNNPMLSYCNIATICNYISANPDQAIFSGNGSNCNEELDVIISCSSLCPDQQIILRSQSDIENFKINYPDCTVPNGIAIGGSDITNLNGLNNLMALRGNLVIGNVNYDTKLIDLSGLESLRRVEGLVQITNNLDLTSLSGLDSLEYIGGDLRLGRGISDDNGNPKLLNLDGLSKLAYIGGAFRIIDAYSLTNLSGLESLRTIGKDIQISNTNNLTSLIGLDNITNEVIDGDFELYGNVALTSLGNFTTLKSIDERLIITANSNLASLSGFENIVSISRSVSFSYNDKLIDFSGLDSLETVGQENNNDTGFTIQGNAGLISLEGLNNLNAISGRLEIAFNDNLENLSALTGLRSTGGLSISSNDKLINLEGLNNVDQISNGLYISGNENLTNISEIGDMDLTNVSYLSIQFNPLLSVCEEVSICNFLKNNNNYSIHDNAIGCNSYEQIIQACDSNLNVIKGTLLFDADQNGCSDSDYNVTGVKVTTTNGVNSYGTFANSLGEYSLYVNQGVYNSSAQINSSNFLINPNAQESDFTTGGNIDIIDFCVTTDQTVNDINITVIPKKEVRPGFETDYQLVYENTGTTVLNGAIYFQFDEALQSFVKAIPSEQTTSSNEIAFDFNGLNPFEKRVIDITMNTFTPPTVNDGDVLTISASIASSISDNTPDNNVFQLEQTAVNSFDPNDKTVLEGAEIDIEDVNKYLNYVIRFQNTGSVSALKVRISDVLSDKLDWTTLKPIAASHLYNTRITDGNFVEFIFDNINLPAQQDDDLGSNGFVAFKVKPKATIQIGEKINGKAEIFFDFNAPITTNTVSTEITTVLSSTDVEEYIVDIYPVPTKDFIYISNSKKINLEYVKLYSIKGQLIYHQRKNFDIINISNLPDGVYFLKTGNGKIELNKKIVKN